MPKKFIKRHMPHHKKVTESKHLEIFGSLLHDSNLWHLNRHSVASAVSIGVFIAFIPLPFHMILAAACAILCRANLPLSIVTVWINNPLTITPIFYYSYRIGAAILNHPQHHFHFELSFAWLTDEFLCIWQPFLLGCLLGGTILAILSNFLVRILWRYSVITAWKKRKLQRKTAHYHA